MAFIIGIFQLILGLFGLSKKPQPTVEAKASADAAAAEVASAVDTQTATKQAAIAQAEVDAPKATPAVIDELNKGEF